MSIRSLNRTARALIVSSAAAILLAACTNPYYEKVKEIVAGNGGPRMALAVAGLAVSSGDSFDFGIVPVSTGKSVVFAISNRGSAALTLLSGTGIGIGGANADQFSVPVFPASSVIPAGSNVTFTVTFLPTSGGVKVASLTIASNDPSGGVFTLALTGQGAAAAPTFIPSPGTYSVDQSVVLYSATSGAVIRYTVDGTTPTAASSAYAAPIPVTGNGTTVVIKAFAMMSGMADSPVVTGTFTINSSVVSTPNFNPPGGPYSADQDIIITSTPGATIYYTTDNTTPTTSSSQFTLPIHVSGNGVTTIKAFAAKAGMTDSTVAQSVYTITYPVAATPTASPPPFPTIYSSPQLVTLNAGVLAIAYTTDGSTPTTDGHGTITHGISYTAPVSVAVNTDIRAIAYGPGLSDSPVVLLSYKLQTAAPIVSPVGGIYATPQTVTVHSSSPGAAIRYTTDGSDPTLFGTVIPNNGTVVISSSVTLRTNAYVIGWYDSTETMAAYTLQNQSPTFTTPAGRIGMGDQVIMSIVTPGSYVIYTFDGTDPASDGSGVITRGTLYGSGITPPFGTTLVKAVAYQAGWADSAVVSRTFTKPLFLYAMALFGGVDIFSLNPATGALMQLGTAGTPIPPGAMAVDSNGVNLYVTGPSMNQIQGYRIDGTTGALTMNGLPHAAVNQGPIVVRRSSDAVYAADSTTSVFAYSIDGSGGLTDFGTYPVGNGPVSVVTDNNSLFLYTANAVSHDVSAYRLTPAGMPYAPTGPFSVGANPADVVVDPSGSHLYVSDSTAGVIYGFTINSGDGSLTPVPGSPFGLAWANPNKMAFDPSGAYLYVTHPASNNVELLHVTTGTGALSVYSSSATGSQPMGVVVDPSGKFVCVANTGDSSISVYSLQPLTGDLTDVVGSPFSTTLGGPGSVLVTGTK